MRVLISRLIHPLPPHTHSRLYHQPIKVIVWACVMVLHGESHVWPTVPIPVYQCSCSGLITAKLLILLCLRKENLLSLCRAWATALGYQSRFPSIAVSGYYLAMSASNVLRHLASRRGNVSKWLPIVEIQTTRETQNRRYKIAGVLVCKSFYHNRLLTFRAGQDPAYTWAVNVYVMTQLDRLR